MEECLYLDDMDGDSSINGHRDRVHAVSSQSNPTKLLVLYVYM